MKNNELLQLPFDEEITEEEQIYRTYRMDFENKRIIGMTSGIEAASQAMYKTLQTRRFAHLIYDDQYGCDVFNKIGNVNLSTGYLDTDIPTMIEDAFLNDEAVIGVNNLSYEIKDGDSVYIKFTVLTIFGDADFEGVIKNG